MVLRGRGFKISKPYITNDSVTIYNLLHYQIDTQYYYYDLI